MRLREVGAVNAEISLGEECMGVNLREKGCGAEAFGVIKE